MANSFAKPVVVWLDDAGRARLMEIAQRIDVPSERVGGSMLARALHECSPRDLGQQESKTTTTRAGKKGVRYCVPRSSKG